MQVLLAAVGTRGDVQPALALALELRELGHGVRLCTSPNFLGWAESLGIDAVPMGVEMRQPAKGASTMPKLTPEELRRLRASLPDLVTDQFDTLAAAAKGCDLIVGANAHQYAAPSIAERARIGYVTTVYAPVAVPSLELAPPPLPGQEASAGSITERWRDVAAAWNERALERVNANRVRLELPPVEDVLEYVLTKHTWLAADPVLAPLPTTPGRTLYQTGSWVLRDPRPLPPELETFLERGEPPIFVGFGSMPAAAEVSTALVGAARAVGRRLVVSKGWANLELAHEAADCITVEDVSHERLFPRVAAVVHHGGAGTTAAAARAGVPQVITPMFSDQFYWANRVVELGVGATTPHASLSEASLADALASVLAPPIRERARSLTDCLSSDGARRAARALADEYG
ncbi:MAG TPA: glycosyltransferase [Polyangiaceae bacterium]|nr:glycosyltransferase [Polyangiaceae bacterium]